MKRHFVIERYFLARPDVAQGNKEDVPIQDLHVAIWFTGMVNIVSTVTILTTIKAPTGIKPASPQHTPVRTPFCLCICDSYAGIFRDLSATLKQANGKTAFTVDCRTANRKSRRKLH